MSENSFLLKKWYLDCTAENGDTAVLYVANLRWNTLSLRYAGLLTSTNGTIASTSSVRGVVEPEIREQVLRVEHPTLKIEGCWQPLRIPIRRTMFQNPHGSVDWHCLQPMSQVELLFCGNRITGLGYAECLTVTVLPWRLPLTLLNWGRYVSPEHALVWVDWQGPESRRHVFHNGEERPVATINESEIVFSDASVRLRLDRGLTLRHGRLGDTIFPGISRLAGLLPHSMLTVEECKWRSRGVFRNAAGESSGWAIHEVVQWKD